MTKTLALEVAEHQINVNAVIPSPTDTPVWRTVPDFEGADFIIGQSLVVNGGSVMI